jgi:hypothetical protein
MRGHLPIRTYHLILPCRVCELAGTKPTTLAGVLVIMRYRRELQEANYTLFSLESPGSDPRDDITAWLAVIERSLEAIAVQS